MDFTDLVDVIDVWTIDANVNYPGSQAFIFLGSAPFTHHAGELRAAGTTNTIVSGDVDGDGVADFSILVIGVTAMSWTDFIL